MLKGVFGLVIQKLSVIVRENLLEVRGFWLLSWISGHTCVLFLENLDSLFFFGLSCMLFWGLLAWLGLFWFA
jgi:hypothetical protein